MVPVNQCHSFQWEEVEFLRAEFHKPISWYPTRFDSAWHNRCMMMYVDVMLAYVSHHRGHREHRKPFVDSRS